MTKEAQLQYIKNNYIRTDSDLYYIKKMIGSNKTLPIDELVERFIEIDEFFKGEPWNLLQILANIDIIIPLEDREEE